ncbi:hypothetical protein AAHA92_12482 [Salvia divinorum]|uniref:Secreted protein n=1 Tax=Salvia divinorum TaxID=28513 RepID=A0ABD1HKK0_SALDI
MQFDIAATYLILLGVTTVHESRRHCRSGLPRSRRLKVTPYLRPPPSRPDPWRLCLTIGVELGSSTPSQNSFLPSITGLPP